MTNFKNRFDEHNNVFQKMKSDTELHSILSKIIKLIANILKGNCKVLICGNGGSAADAQHLAAEFVGRFKKKRKALNVEALSTNTSIITAIGNDYGFDKIFSRQVEAKGSSMDVLIGISTSGNSKNIVEAFKQARVQNMTTIAITGDFEDMECEKYADYILKVPSIDTARIQEAHTFLYHIIAEFVENEFV